MCGLINPMKRHENGRLEMKTTHARMHSHTHTRTRTRARTHKKTSARARPKTDDDALVLHASLYARTHTRTHAHTHAQTDDDALVLHASDAAGAGADATLDMSELAGAGARHKTMTTRIGTSNTNKRRKRSDDAHHRFAEGQHDTHNVDVYRAQEGEG